MLYPEKLLTQHFLSPPQREAVRAALLESQKKSFTVLVQLLREMGEEDDQCKDLHSIPKMLEQVINTRYMHLEKNYVAQFSVKRMLPTLPLGKMHVENVECGPMLVVRWEGIKLWGVEFPRSGCWRATLTSSLRVTVMGLWVSHPATLGPGKVGIELGSCGPK